MRKAIIVVLVTIISLVGCNDNKTISDYESKISSYEKDISNLENVILQKDDEIQALVDARESSDDLYVLLREKNSVLEDELIQKERQIETLTEGNKSLLDENRILLNSVDEKNSLISKLMYETSKLSQQLYTYTGSQINENSSKIYNPFIISSSTSGIGVFKGYVFGGYSDEKWFTLEDFMPYNLNDHMRIDLIKGDEEYTFYRTIK